MDLKKISKNTVDRYTKRYDQLGHHIRTLGWGDESQQEYRFLNTLEASDLNNKSVLDLGCGFGDFCIYMSKNNMVYSSYTGWDMNSNFIKEGKKNLNLVNAQFDVVDIATEDLNKYEGSFDVALMLGLLNFNLKSEKTNYSYSFEMISKSFKLVSEVLIVDFLSTSLTDDYPKEDFVFYHDPLIMLKFALKLSPNVVLKHNYAPIPQKEFMLFIYK